MKLAPPPPDAPRLVFRRGGRYPRAIAWFGARSFWGHLWRLGASVVATEDIDSRDWMQPDEPGELTARMARVLGGDPAAATLTEAVGGDLWIDFIADTGDDSSVSYAVARMLFSSYEVDDPEHPGATLELPRGRVLLFGGDTAYPVATELEIYNRVVVPFNRALRKSRDKVPRVLLGVPGNHDWYGGLDGFGRMFKRRRGAVGRADKGGLEDLETDRGGNIRHFARWVEAFRVGSFVAKRRTLPLAGYTPVQSASYFALRLAPALDLFGPDRQLRGVDFHQRTFFAGARDGQHARGLFLAMADPAFAFLEPSDAGQGILEALDVDLARDGPLVLTGDTHHYCRQTFGPAVHVTAGGGGAFLHPAPIRREGLPPPDAEFPGPRATLALAVQIPLQIAHFRAGTLVHAALALLYAPTFALTLASGRDGLASPVVTGFVAAVLCLLVGGWRTGKAFRIGLLAALTGAAIAMLPIAVQSLESPVAKLVGIAPFGPLAIAIPYAVTVYLGTIVAGAFLTALTLLGLEQHQAFSALAHPGYKHVVRLRVKADGSRIDAWTLGKIDPLDKKEPVALVDSFSWRNPRGPA